MSAGLVFDALLSLPFCFRNPQRYFSIWGQIFLEFAFEFLRPIVAYLISGDIKSEIDQVTHNLKNKQIFL